MGGLAGSAGVVGAALVFGAEVLEDAAADADKNGIVTFNELSDYVAGKVKTETGGRQNPQRSGLGDISLAVSTAPGGPAQ